MRYTLFTTPHPTTATFDFKSSSLITPISTTCLILHISMPVVFACKIVYLATRRLSLASLDPSRILVTTGMFFVCTPKHWYFVNTLVIVGIDGLAMSKVAHGTLSCDVRIVDSIMGPLTVVLVNTCEGISHTL